MIGFDRLASWAPARQARLLDELARRRPTDKAPYSARWACVGSEYAPDEVGVALHLSRGTACARIGLARRLLATLPDTHALWEAGRIDTAKARAIDDATVVLLRRTRPGGGGAGAAEGAGADPGPAQGGARPGGDRRRPGGRRASGTGRPAGTGGSWSPPRPTGWRTLWAMLTAPDAAGAFTWLTRLARGLGADDPRRWTPAAPTSSPPCSTAASSPTPTPTRNRRGGRPATAARRRRRPRPTAPTRRRRRPAPRPRLTATRPARAGAGRPIHPVTPGKPLIQIVIPYSTLIGADDQPAELAGYGPIPASPGPRDRRRRGLETPGHRPTVRHPARPRPHHLPPTRRARRPRPSPRPLLPRPRLPTTSRRRRTRPRRSPGPTAAPPASKPAGYCTHHHRLKTHAPAGGSRPTPTAASPGPPPPATGTPPSPTTTAPNHHHTPPRCAPTRPEPPPPTTRSLLKAAHRAPTEPDPDPPPF